MRLGEDSFSIGVGGMTGLTNGIPTGGDGKGVIAFPLFTKKGRKNKSSKSRRKKRGLEHRIQETLIKLFSI